MHRIEITDIRDNTYYALLHLERESDVFTLDSRPSDAIALALRCRVPIMVSGEVMQHALPIENLEGMPEGKDKLTELLEKMDPETIQTNTRCSRPKPDEDRPAYSFSRRMGGRTGNSG